ncbi:MAG: hypothetical protein FJX62_22530 [Alphaproteobacteria bacterium]|nr:hypothetical protein [Alphaproteobacteria bacterium]
MALRDAILTGDLAELREFSAYLDARHRRLKEQLSIDDRNLLNSNIEALQKENIFVLRQGEIEDYLPTEFTQIDKIIEMLTDKDWLLLVQGDRRDELLTIACTILESNRSNLRQLIDGYNVGERVLSLS